MRQPNFPDDKLPFSKARCTHRAFEFQGSAYRPYQTLPRVELGRSGMNGFALAEQVSQRYPEVEIILSSGDPNISNWKLPKQKSLVKVLLKPYSVRELTSCVEDVMAEAARRAS